MQCHNCKKSIDEDAKFCNFCGVGVLSKRDKPLNNQNNEGSVDIYFKKKHNSCQACGIYAPTKYIEFYQNIGALVVRYNKFIKGNLCKSCIKKYFWQFTLIDLIGGWWGVISFFVTPFYIINNVVRYVGSLGLKSPEQK